MTDEAQNQPTMEEAMAAIGLSQEFTISGEDLVDTNPEPAPVVGEPGSLVHEVLNKPVRYWMTCGRLTLRPKDNAVVQLQGGGFAAVPTEGFYIERDGHRNMNPWTREYDPKKPADAQAIAIIDAFIRDYPMEAQHVNVGLSRWNEADAGIPFPKWEHSDVAGIERAYTATGFSVPLDEAMRYELTHQQREDVITLLEKIAHNERGQVADEAARQTVAL